MTPRTKEQNEEIRLRRLAQIRMAAADVFLDKGLTLEIRDVAAEAGLGYGTVYHYYSNKGDLLHDVLWTALDRAGEWMDRGDPGDIPPTGTEDADVIADPLVAAGARLLQLWAEDHGVYLLYKLAAEGFRLLPEARALPLTDAFRREVLLPFAAVLGRGAGTAKQVSQAEMLLAALAGCASFPLRRGTLDREAEGIARLLLHRLSERTVAGGPSKE
ncbi:MAG: TetR/AcrR family transcriptional regulator [Paenibacillaceae bacterium]|uniref:TetR/AcrR family transcriptional regulator n=1 Tax=Paenibacillus mellifer TaxID=2937794 RepID=A0A9X1XWM2_9BACL|nr:TetR/AcrR family transcriptional regulator [Paenibacillus mellifer]MBW4841124.1 TetR/AcrR family transcriptional regulator [Paenibacillaceae bacterium]MCK8486151.1 TetR/AcrR family transcriptional regulator [Paenibacillus mellifer]